MNSIAAVTASAVCFLGGAASAAPLTFAGVQFAPGATVRANVPLSSQEKSYSAQGGNSVPENAVAVIVTPANFDPKQSWPVLVVCSTSDNHRQNRDDLVDFYRRVANAEGWVVLAGDGPQFPRNDTAGWRGAMTLAAIDALRRSFTGGEKWPVAVAGFSGGGKAAGSIAPLLAISGCHVIGIYLTGANADYLSGGYARCSPGAQFLQTPVYVSIGLDDRIATQDQQYSVISSIKRTGFKRVRMGTTLHGGHRVFDGQTQTALRWFRQLANAP
ncbi:MAG: hypothetical protein JO354_08030 [Verrucomicrobia bacterium]|nr:hypothetical protein [Verrucomicrobiota bacterium]